MRRRAPALLAGVALMVAACAGDGERSTTTGSELAISDLSGNWDNGEVVLRVNDEGDYEVVASESADPARTLMFGFIAREGNRFNFVTGISGECAGQTGVYEAAITDDLLTLTLVDDPCERRVAGFVRALSKTG